MFLSFSSPFLLGLVFFTCSAAGTPSTHSGLPHGQTLGDSNEVPHSQHFPHAAQEPGLQIYGAAAGLAP